MNFDQNWEDAVYSKTKQINRYPFDWVVSTVNRQFSNEPDPQDLGVLELGCGTGNNLEFLLDYGFGAVHGIDGSPSAIEKAGQLLGAPRERLELILGDFTKLPAAPKTYSLILDRGSVTHNSFEACTCIIAEAYRVLKPGGIIASTLFSHLHSAVKSAQPVGRSCYRAFHSAAGVEDGLVTTFFDESDVRELFAEFELTSLINEVRTEVSGEHAVSAMWLIIAKKT